jgi:glycosyltransferase involved in cell wall biosynthesis
VAWESSVASSSVTERLAKGSIFVLPSINEPFPMAVLEAMSVGLPVIITDTCGLAQTVRTHKCGIVIRDSQTELIMAIQHLIENEPEREAMGYSSLRAVASEFSMHAIGDRLVSIYAEATSI